MRNSDLDILVYLFDKLLLNTVAAVRTEFTVEVNLLEQGFSPKEISSAMTWLRIVAKRQSEIKQVVDDFNEQKHGIRLFNRSEQEKLGVDAINFLLKLEYLGLLELAMRELIIEMGMCLNIDKYSLVEFKKIVAIVMFEHPNLDKVLCLMEEDYSNNVVH